MTIAFWTPWALWIKLCFILGGAIVLVVLLGFTKRIHNHWKLRSYIKLETSKVATNQGISQQMQHQPSVRRGRANQVPFGVRALESGIEVDGVWISRPNTPASSLPGSPALSGTTHLGAEPDPSKGKAPSSSNMSSMEVSQPLHVSPDVKGPSSSSPTVRNPLERPARQHKQPPTSDHQPRGRTTYQPRRSSHLRFSNSFDPEDSETLAALEAHSMLTAKEGKRPEGSDSERDGRRLSVSWSGSSSNSGNGDPRQRSQPAAPSTGFPNPEYSKGARNSSQAYELYDVDPVFSGQQTDTIGGGQAHFQELVNDKRAGRVTADDGVYGHSASLVHKISDPFGPSDAYNSAKETPVFGEDEDISNQHTRLMDNNEIDYGYSQAQSSRPFDGNRRARKDQILRKVNSNFQILRPGTLGAPRPSNDHNEWQVDIEAADKRSSKKLQKRGRASSRSSYTLEK